MSHRIFLGCNYNDKSVKSTFDNLKKALERDLPVEIVIIDKQTGRHAKDLWNNIKQRIEEAAFCIFDVSAFRPNVVLELGYALSIKEEKSVAITFRSRKSKGKKPDWLLSDITHLNRIEYKLVTELKDKITEEIENLEFMKIYRSQERLLGGKTETQKHWAHIRKLIFEIRDNRSRSKSQIKTIIQGSSLKLENFIDLVLSTKLIEEKNGRYVINESGAFT